MPTQYFDNKTAFLEPTVTQYGSKQVMTNVTKPKKIKYINIDTRFSDDYAYHKTDFNKIDNHSMTLHERLSEVTSIKVSQIEIPMTFFNISSSLGNNYFLLVNITDNTKTVITFPDGNYSTLNILQQFQLQLDSFFDVMIDNNNFIHLTNISQSTLVLDFAIDSTGFFDKYQFKSKFGWLLGFRNVNYNLLPGTEINAESILNLNTIRYLYLVFDEFTNSFPNSFCPTFSDSIMNKKILARISIDNTFYPFGTVLFGNEYNAALKSDKRTYSGKVDMIKLSIQLVNEIGKPINLNGSDFSFLLEIEHE